MRIAVVGSGISGLGAAWLLQQRHEVTLYERNDYAGGHTHTLEVATPQGPVAVDTGFMVYNRRNYPLLSGLFGHLGITVQKTDMSFGVSLGEGRLEYAGSGLAALFAQPRNWASPRHYRMLADILRFNRAAHRALQEGTADTETLGAFLDRGGYGPELRHRYLLPMAAAIWSCPPGTMEAFPARSLFRFFANHGLLDLRNRPQWYTVSGGSRTYSRAMLARFHGPVRLGHPVRAVQRREQGVDVTDDSGATQRFDAIVFGSHADETLAMLADADPRERQLLSRFRYQANRVLLHSDPALMPKRQKVWSSWNYLAREEQGRTRAVSVTYWMNRLQSLQTAPPLFVSLNPLREPATSLVHAEMSYDHPVFDGGAIQAQPWLAQLQGRNRTWFCGSYFGYGFHEDGLRSAVQVAEQLGARVPWRQTGTASATDRARLDPALAAS